MSLVGWKAECLSPAKLNVTLDICGPDSTGFHPIDSVVCPISLNDEMSFTIRKGARGVRLVLKDKRPNAIAHPAIPRDERNLVVQAANRILDLRPDFDETIWITLIKNIPSEAGLGAGSSNAAMTIRVLGEILGITQRDRLQIAGDIGSDVSLFLYDGAVRMQQYGGNITPVSISGNLEGVIVRPDTGMSTPAAYKALDANPARVTGSATLTLLASGCLSPEMLSNDFEGVVRQTNSGVANLFDKLLGLGAIRVQLCGSGSAVFACTNSRTDSIKIIKAISGDFPYMKLVTTL